MKRVSTLVAVFAAICGCGDAGEGRLLKRAAADSLSALLNDPSRHPIRGGLLSGEEAISWIVTARVTPDGQHVVVLDEVEPYVRVFRRDGRVRSAFVRTGRGPGEARSPTGLAVRIDQIAVLHGGRRVSLFDLDGAFHAEWVIEGFWPMALGRGCGAAWAAYGPTRAPGMAPPNMWLHELDLGREAGPLLRSLYGDSVIPADVAFGRNVGLTFDGTRILAFHLDGRPRVVLSYDCARQAAAVVAEHPERYGDGSAPRVVDLEDGTTGASFLLRNGQPIFTGMTALGTATLMAELIVGEDSTRFTLVDGEEFWELKVPGIYEIEDADSTAGVLFSTEAPYPRFFLVRTEDLSAALGRAADGASRIR